MSALKSALGIFTLLIFFISCTEKTTTASPVQCQDNINPDTLQVPTNQMKGWEVYAWPGCGDWNFSLLYGTNSLKTYNEVTGAQAGSRLVIKAWSTEKMKKVLARIPAGHTVSLIGDQWLHRTWGAGTYGDLRLPPANVTTALQLVAARAGIDFRVVN